MTIGIDVFEGNGSPDWDAAIKTGNLGFVGVRATEATHRDTRYKQYRTELRARGIPSFAYGFLRFEQTGPSPEDQGNALLDAMGLQDDHELTPAIDLEIPGGSLAKFGITASQAVDWFLRCYHTVKSGLGGADPGVYTSYVVCVDPEGLAGIPIPELADAWSWTKYWPYAEGTRAVYSYPTVNAIHPPKVAPQFEGNWTLHQYQGDATMYPGFGTKVDMNRSRVVAFSEKSDTVRWIQRKLKRMPFFSHLVVDGDFGPETDSAVRSFQSSRGLIADGAVGYLTSAALSRVRL